MRVIIQQKVSNLSQPSSSLQYLRCLISWASCGVPNTLHSINMPKTRQKCLQLSILSCFGVILPSAKRKEGRMPQAQSPPESTPLRIQQCGMWQYLSAQLAKTRVSAVWKMTCAAAICLLFSIRKPALLQSSQQIHLMPQKCWCCHAIMYRNIANGSTMQKLLPEATQPKYTGKLPTTDPTIVFHSDLDFILVQMKRQPPQMAAPMAAVIGLQLQRPSIPKPPSRMPLQSAYLGGVPSTNGLCDVRTIFLSYSTSIYWLSDCVDMDKATDERKRGSGEQAVAYMLQLATVTIPFSSDSLNLVSSLYFLRYLSKPPPNKVFIQYIVWMVGFREQQPKSTRKPTLPPSKTNPPYSV